MTDANVEEKALKLSIVGAIMMAALGIGFALFTRSEAIMLDGLFSLISFAMGLLSLKVARLVRQPDDEHYQFGYASFEPFVNVTKGFIMAFVGVFALYSSIDALLNGGRPIASGYAALYAVFGAAVCLLIARRQRKIADVSGSPLVEVDAKGWLIDGLITSAVCVGFLIVLLIEKTRFANLVPYADPAIVIALVLGSAPLPYSVIRANLKELLMGAPEPPVQDELRAGIARATKNLPIQETVIRMNKMGRSLYLHLYLLVPESHQGATVKELDTVRSQIIEELSETFPALTIDVIFTTERRYTHL
jgi:cation diffusion facilitator family transporter